VNISGEEKLTSGYFSRRPINRVVLNADDDLLDFLTGNLEHGHTAPQSGRDVGTCACRFGHDE